MAARAAAAAAVRGRASACGAHAVSAAEAAADAAGALAVSDLVAQEDVMTLLAPWEHQTMTEGPARATMPWIDGRWMSMTIAEDIAEFRAMAPRARALQ